MGGRARAAKKGNNVKENANWSRKKICAEERDKKGKKDEKRGKMFPYHLACRHQQEFPANEELPIEKRRKGGEDKNPFTQHWAAIGGGHFGSVLSTAAGAQNVPKPLARAPDASLLPVYGAPMGEASF